MKLTSPNYPEPYNPGEDCIWKITAPQGHYVTLEFERIDVSNKLKWKYYFLSHVLTNKFLYSQKCMRENIWEGVPGTEMMISELKMRLT